MTWLKHTLHMIMLCSNPKHTPQSGVLQPNLLNRKFSDKLPYAYTRTQNKKIPISPLYT